MANLGRRWAGRAFGTNIGNLFVDFDSGSEGVSGTLRFMDESLGLSIFKLRGAFDGSALVAEGAPESSAPGVESGTLKISGALTSEGSFRGDWETSLGTAGTFSLHPHDVPMTSHSPSAATEQLHTAVLKVGAVRLYADDIVVLIQSVSQDFNQGKVVVVYRQGGVEIARYADELLRDGLRGADLNYIKIVITEPEGFFNLSKNAQIELDYNGSNEIRVQGIQKSWVLGKAEALRSSLSGYEKRLATGFRQLGPNVNTILFLASIVVLPDLPTIRRVMFFVFVIGIIWAIGQVHSKFIPNVLVSLGPERPSLFARSWPQILSWLIALTSAVVASIFYAFLKGFLKLPS